MLSKAAVFRDHDAFVAMLSPGLAPAEYKRLGRSVEGFNGAIWDRVILAVAFEACFQKFGGGSGEDIKQVLLSTGDSLLVEASPKDCIWGVGLSERDPSLHDPKLWQLIYQSMSFLPLEVQRNKGLWGDYQHYFSYCY
jgi:ribA/ribD-fused uncharacterized protein